MPLLPDQIREPSPVSFPGNWTIAGGSSLPILTLATLKSNDTIEDYYSVDSGKVFSVLESLNEIINK